MCNDSSSSNSDDGQSVRNSGAGNPFDISLQRVKAIQNKLSLSHGGKI